MFTGITRTDLKSIKMAIITQIILLVPQETTWNYVTMECIEQSSKQPRFYLTNFYTELKLITLTYWQLIVMIIFRLSLKSSWFSVRKNEISLLRISSVNEWIVPPKLGSIWIV